MTQRFLLSCTKTGAWWADDITSEPAAHGRAVGLGLKDYEIAELILVDEGFFRICEASGKVREARDPRHGFAGSAILEAGVVYATKAFVDAGCGQSDILAAPVIPTPSRGLFSAPPKG